MPRPTDTPGVSWHRRGRVLLEIRFIRGSSDGIGEVGDPPCGVDVCGRWLVLVLVDGVGIGVGIGAIVRILRGEVIQIKRRMYRDLDCARVNLERVLRGDGSELTKVKTIIYKS